MSPRKSFSIPATSGFSLLELIIVLVIIGILVAVISLSITDTRGDNLRLEARRLAARLSLAQDEAILTNQEFGLEITREGYRFLVLLDDRWQEIDAFGERQLIQQDLPENMIIDLQVEGLYAQFQSQDTTQVNINTLFEDYDERNNSSIPTLKDENNSNETPEEAESAKKLRPQIYLMSSGEINPFTLLVGYDDESPVYYQLKATYDGEVSLKGPIREPFGFAKADKE